MVTRREFLLKTTGVAVCSSLDFNSFAGIKGTPRNMPSWDFLKEGDVIDVIAPSSPIDNPQERYKKIEQYFKENTPFKINIPDHLIEPTALLDEANTIWKRAKFVYDAFCSESKAIWAISGGGWGASILGELMSYPKPDKIKPIIGYSDITALHIYANEYLNFPSIHSVVLGINGDIFPGYNKNGLGATLDILSGKKTDVIYELSPLNKFAASMTEVTGKIVGGNSLLVSALNGASRLSLKTKGKFLFLESIADDPGQFSRKLMGLAYSPVIKNCLGVIFGDVIKDGGKTNSPLVQSQFDYIIHRFSEQFIEDKIALKANNIFGHGAINMPLPLNTFAVIKRNGASIIATISANRL